MSKYKEYAVVCSQEQIAADIYSLWIQTEEIARAAGPGQFLSVYTGDGTKLLPRPISICEIDREQGRLRLVSRVTGPAIKPVAVRMVYQAAHAVKIPVIGMGGIATAEDALEFILAGATAVSVGTMNFRNPAGTLEIIRGIEAYMERFGIQDIRELIGGVRDTGY